MIDFSTLKGLTIPEGNVTQIADASGSVLWSAVEKVTVNIKTSGMFITGSIPASVTINGVSYNSATTVDVPKGSVIVCSAPWVTLYNSTNRSGGEVKLNGTIVAPWVVGVNPTIYEYTVNGDIEIMFSYANVPTGAGYSNTRTGTNISITEL